MKLKAIACGLSLFLLSACVEQTQQVSCVARAGDTVSWKDYSSGRGYSNYFSYFKMNDGPGRYCKVDNKEIYNRVEIGGTIPWDLDGFVIINQ